MFALVSLYGRKNAKSKATNGFCFFVPHPSERWLDFSAIRLKADLAAPGLRYGQSDIFPAMAHYAVGWRLQQAACKKRRRVFACHVSICFWLLNHEQAADICKPLAASSQRLRGMVRGGILCGCFHPIPQMLKETRGSFRSTLASVGDTTPNRRTLSCLAGV